MTALIVDRKDARLSLDGGCLRVLAGETRLDAPLGQIERVIVRGAATLETGLLARLWGQGIGLLVLSGRRGEPTARFHGQPANDVSRRIAQVLAACDPAEALAIARPFVAAKLLAQRRTLERLAAGRPAVRPGAIVFTRSMEELKPRLERAVSLDALRGHEGGAARLYWSALAGAFADSLGFSGRNRRPPRDPVNACLSLAYTIATFEAAAQAQRHGLDPMIGFLHAPAFGRESLGCDLVEPLRPRIDLWIEGLFRARMLRREHFTTDANGACLMGKAGRAAFYEAFGEMRGLWSRWLGQAAGRLARALGERAPSVFEAAEEVP